MATYYFTIKNENEAFAPRVRANSIIEATALLAAIKKMPISEFEKLYDVKRTKD